MTEQNLIRLIEIFAGGVGVALTVYVKPAVVSLWSHWQEHHKGRTEAFQQLASAVSGQTAILGTQTKMLREIQTSSKRERGVEAAALTLLESRLKETRMEMRRTLRGTREEIRGVDDRFDQFYGLFAAHLAQQAESLSDDDQIQALGVRTHELFKILRRIEIQREERQRALLRELQDQNEEESDEHSEVIERLLDFFQSEEGEDDD